MPWPDSPPLLPGGKALFASDKFSVVAEDCCCCVDSISDDFNRADMSVLNDAWQQNYHITPAFGGIVVPIQLADNRAMMPFDLSSFEHNTIAMNKQCLNSPDQTISARISSVITTVSSNATTWLYARWNSVDLAESSLPTGYALISFSELYSGYARLRLVRYGPLLERLATTATGSIPLSGGVLRFDVIGTGTTVALRAYVNGVLRLMYDDTSAERVTTGEYVGFGFWFAAGYLGDQMRLDDFSAAIV